MLCGGVAGGSSPVEATAGDGRWRRSWTRYPVGMSVLRPTPPEDPLVVEGLAPPDAARRRRAADTLTALLAAAGRRDRRVEAVLAVEPLLAEYGITRSRARRRESRLFAILTRARAIAGDADRVVFLSAPAALDGVRLLLGACADPWHAQASRGARAGRPILVCLEARHDADAVGALVDLLGVEHRHGPPRDLLDRAALVVCGPATAASTDIVAALKPTVGDRVWRGDDLAGPAEDVDAGAILGGPGLLAGALAGIDVVRLLVGAAAMVARCRAAPDESPAAILAASLHGTAAPPDVLVEPRALGGLVAWHAHAAARCRATAAAPRGAIAVNADATRRDLSTASPAWHEAPRAAAAATVAALRAGDVPGAVIRLPRVDEHALGQTVALLLLAAATADHPPDSERPAAVV